MKTRYALILFILFLAKTSQAQTVEREIRPSLTDPRIEQADEPHLVRYVPTARAADLLVFLPGTNGKPATGPQEFYKTVTDQRLRLIALSYVDAPSLSKVCTAELGDALCPAHFREKRLFGRDVTPLISDTPADAIVNRLTKLLHYLAQTDPAGEWDQYLIAGAPRWDRIIVSGQSQGGGMAAFLAKKFSVAKVLTFSGGWDNGGRRGTLAPWYAAPSATAPEKWYGTYHVLEPQGQLIARTYRALDIPQQHVFAMDKEVPDGKLAHVQGVKNPVYKPVWLEMLADQPRGGQMH